MLHLIQPMLRPLGRWAEQSQTRACRNAMVASTSITAGLRERDEVQRYVDTTLARRGAQRERVQRERLHREQAQLERARAARLG